MIAELLRDAEAGDSLCHPDDPTCDHDLLLVREEVQAARDIKINNLLNSNEVDADEKVVPILGLPAVVPDESFIENIYLFILLEEVVEGCMITDGLVPWEKLNALIYFLEHSLSVDVVSV